MIDLLRGGSFLMRDLPMATYNADGHQAVLLQRIKDRSLLTMEYGKDDEVDLDSATWRQKKVKDKAVQFLTSLDEGTITNKVIKAAIDVLERDGRIVTGLHGNLLTELVSRGYTAKSARSEAAQTVTMLRLLRVVDVMDCKTSVPNRASLILQRIRKLA